MPAKNDAAGELAEKMVRVLEAQRRLGGNSYPLTLRRLAELTDPGALPELILKAAGKKKPFGEQVIAVKPKDLDTPVALADDAQRLAASPLLLEYTLGLACSAKRPTCEPATLKSKVPAPLRAPFEAVLRNRVEAGDLPPTVELVSVRNKQCLHPRRYPIPKKREVALAEKLVDVLKAQRKLGEDSYPLTFDRLVELAQPGDDAQLLKKAVGQRAFKEQVVPAVKGPKNLSESPVALKGDDGRLAASALVLETALKLARSEKTQASEKTEVYGLAELTKHLIPALKAPFQAAVNHAIRNRSLPPGVGSLLQKGKPVLFLLSDVVTGPRARPAPPPTLPTRPAAPGAFASRFDEAFDRLQHGARMPNFVSLVELRRALPFDRPTFDAGLQRLRQSGRYGLSAAEGRHGISPEECEAGIHEDGALLLYVSRK
jgi:hypothetical protein